MFLIEEKSGFFLVILTRPVINITENRVVIRKMRQHKSGQALRCPVWCSFRPEAHFRELENCIIWLVAGESMNTDE